MRKEGVSQGRMRIHEGISGEGNAQKKRLRGIKRLALPFFEEQSGTKN